MRVFNNDVEKVLCEYIKNTIIPNYKIKPCDRPEKIGDEKKKIAFVYDRIVMNSPGKLLYSLLEVVTKNNPLGHEYYVYDLECIEKSPSNHNMINHIRKLGVKYLSAHAIIDDKTEGHYYSHLNKCLKLRERIVRDEIDILIMNNSREHFNLLYTTRTAPKQVFWCHGNFEYDVDGIDERMSHISKDMQQNDFEVNRFSLIQSEIFLSEVISQHKQEAEKSESNFRPGQFSSAALVVWLKLKGKTISKLLVRSCPISQKLFSSPAVLAAQTISKLKQNL